MRCGVVTQDWKKKKKRRFSGEAGLLKARHFLQAADTDIEHDKHSQAGSGAGDGEPD